MSKPRKVATVTATFVAKDSDGNVVEKFSHEVPVGVFMFDKVPEEHWIKNTAFREAIISRNGLTKADFEKGAKS